MSISFFQANPILDVERFIEKHYNGGTVLDFGCGSGRYSHCFPEDMYVGVDGDEGNIKSAQERYPDRTYIHANLEEWEPEGVFDNVFSSVVFDQTWARPYGIGKKLILIEPEFYVDEINPEVCEVLDCSRTTRMMVKEEL